MKLSQFSLLALVLFLTLSGVRGCGPDPQAVAASIAQAAITASVGPTNEPDNRLEKVAATTPTIYLAAEVLNPKRSTVVKVVWQQLPGKVLATELFDGKRQDSGNQFDFEYRSASSWLLSQIKRPGLSWPLGSYRTEVYLGNRLAKTVFFDVVADADAEQQLVERMINQVVFGDAITGSNQLANRKTTFARTADNIYIQIRVVGAPVGTNLNVGVRYIKDNLVFDPFTSVVRGDQTLLLTLSRSRFGKLWSDGLWAEGSFEVTVKVDGTIARTATFRVVS